MKRIVPLITAATVLGLVACSGGGGQDAETGKKGEASKLALDSEAQKRSYALGMDVGRSLSDLPVEVKPEYVAAGLSDALQDQARLDDQSFQEAKSAFVSSLEESQKEQQKAEADKNQKAGQAFLAEKAGEEGVEKTDSGLLYKVVEPGDGPKPAADDSVKVHYEGRLIDGTVFDSSRERGEPVTFPVNAVIPGWTEALQLMKEGAEYKLYIPPELAYGERGAGSKIGPNATLVFDVELLEVIPKEEQSEGGDGAGGDQG